MQDEILKHGRKAYKEMKSADHSFWHKTKEVLIEIGIIVFAVTLSIWLHSWSEHRHQQKEVRDFMSDLKEDLHADIKSMQSAREALLNNRNNAAFIEGLTPNSVDSLIKANASLGLQASIGTTKINNGNYEGFKSSGKIGFIENKALKKDILKYYQELAPGILEAEKINATLALKASDFWIENAGQNIRQIILNPKLKGMLGMFQHTSKGSMELYQQAIDTAKKIITEIDNDSFN